MEDKKLLFSEYFKANPISEISLVAFLYFCRDKVKIFIIDEKRSIQRWFIQSEKEKERKGNRNNTGKISSKRIVLSFK